MFHSFTEIKDIELVQPFRVAAVCPHCGSLGTLDTCKSATDLTLWSALGARMIVGHRLCPNRSCRGYIFVFWEDLPPVNTVSTFPAHVATFERGGVPAQIVSTFEEACQCFGHACYVAAAMLVRKTVELLCEEKGADGKVLFDRVESLRNIVLFPPALFQGIHNLRLLGNDAAHITSKDFEVGREQVEVAIDFCKQLLQAVYGYAKLAERLESLKKADH